MTPNIPRIALYNIAGISEMHISSLMSEAQLGIHADDAANKIPVTIQANPIGHQDTCTAVPIALLLFATDVIHCSWIDLGGNLLGPSIRFPEVTCAQEIDVEGEILGFVHGLLNTEGVVAVTRAIYLLSDKLDLLLDVERFLHLIEILNAELTTGAACVRGVVCPRCGINTPSRATVLLLEVFR